MSAIDFNEQVGRMLWSTFDRKDGWEIYSEQVLSSGHKVDFVITQGNQVIVCDAKYKDRLELPDIQQMALCKSEFGAYAGWIVIPEKTFVPNDIAEYTRKVNIEIVPIRYEDETTRTWKAIGVAAATATAIGVGAYLLYKLLSGSRK